MQKYFLVFLSISILLPIRAMVTSKRRDLLGFFISSQCDLLPTHSRGIRGKQKAINEAEKKQLANIKSLLQEGLDCNPSLFKIGPLKRSVICAAAEYNDIELLDLLLERGIDINTCDNHGTALHEAAEMSNNVLCKYLLQKGANPNIQDKLSDTPLDNAILFKNVSAIKSLTQYSANINDTQATKLIEDTKFDLKKEYYSYIKNFFLTLKRYNNVFYDLRFLILSYLPEYHCHPGLYKELQNKEYVLKPLAWCVVEGHTKVVQEIFHTKNEDNKNILELHPSIKDLNEKLLSDAAEFKRKYPDTSSLQKDNLAFEVLKRYAFKYESLIPKNILSPQENAALCLDISLEGPPTVYISQQ